MALILPYGAEPILRARISNQRPADMILISNLPVSHDQIKSFENAKVFVEPNQTYDWRWLAGLPCCFYGVVDANLLGHIENASKALKTRLEKIWVWDVNLMAGMDAWYLPDADTIHLHKSQWEWNLSFLDWTDYQNKGF